jgi:hypothetical protein
MKGMFGLARVPPGDYRLEVRASGFELLTQAVTVPPLQLFNPGRFPSLALEDIPGVGKALATRLRAGGIKHPAGVASADPTSLAQVLGGVSEAKARAVIDAARALLSG